MTNSFEKAVNALVENANSNAHKKPKFTTLLEEFSELVLSLRGKHEHTPELELVQIGGVVLNLLAQIYEVGNSSVINNIKSTKHESQILAQRRR